MFNNKSKVVIFATRRDKNRSQIVNDLQERFYLKLLLIVVK